MGRLPVVVVALIVVTSTGCRQVFGIDPTVVATGDASDAPVDGEPGAVDASGPDAATCFGSDVVVVCLDAAPTEPVVIVGGTLDTDSPSSCRPVRSITTPACVISGTSIDVAGMLRVTGSLPLVLVASGPIRVNGTIDAASRRVGGAGAGSGSSDCALGSNAIGSGGGAGGSFGASGGNGGSGASGGASGVSGPVAAIVALRGGCPGGAGGGSDDSEAGAGGGAVYLIAATQIRIEGTINASGAAGAGGLPSVDGGSGGGSGGLIGLEAPEVFVGASGRVFANGGGGWRGRRHELDRRHRRGVDRAVRSPDRWRGREPQRGRRWRRRLRHEPGRGRRQRRQQRGWRWRRRLRRRDLARLGRRRHDHGRGIAAAAVRAPARG